MAERNLTHIPTSVLHNPKLALTREWLVTNGIGGYASSTVLGANTRRYHGLLVASFPPPLERQVLLSKVDEELTVGEDVFQLGVNEYRDGHIDPHGYQFLKSFRLESGIPTFEYHAGEVTLTKQVWMEHGKDTVYILYRVTDSPGRVTLKIRPFCAFRSYHHHAHGGSSFECMGVNGGQVAVGSKDVPYLLTMIASTGSFATGEDRYWNFLHRAERERGFDYWEDLYTPGVFTARLAKGGSLGFVATCEPSMPSLDIEEELRREIGRRRAITTTERDPLRRELLLAADQFVAAMPDRRAESNRKCILAGYHWFTDWGRDTMISLPGLLLSTGRFEEAREILSECGRYIRRGMLPNRFSDEGNPEYNTVDATLWYFEAIRKYVDASGDVGIIDCLFPKLAEIIEHHLKGTDFGIRVDDEDGLLWAGQPDTQLTWMDACVEGCPVTPRIGKPVEINALWFNALSLMHSWAKMSKQPAEEYRLAAKKCAESFRRKFWYRKGGYLFDVIEGPTGNDPSLRPNQIFAVSLSHSPLSPARRKSVVDVVERVLLTPYGLRTLSPDDPAYRGVYRGGPVERDCTYHQGTVWPWLLGHFADAHFRVHQDREYIASLLKPFVGHLSDAGIGSISEIFDGDEPHTPGGCISQAWSVAEILRMCTDLHSTL